MIISKTPLRIPFFSGGSDRPIFYKKDTGAALSVTIDKYVYVIVHETDDDCIRFHFDGENEKLTDLALMKHQITRETLNAFGFSKGLSISVVSDINHRGTGLGSSSAYTVGLVNCLYKLILSDEYRTRSLIADEACYIELEMCKFPIGRQDQYSAAYGGFNLFSFHYDNTVKVNQINIRDDIHILQDNLFLINTNIERHSGDILRVEESFDGIKKNRDFAFRGHIFLLTEDYDGFGNLFNEYWENKKQINKLTTSTEIDLLRDRLMSAGAMGGKVLGAGGGGFMMFYVPKKNHTMFKLAVNEAGLFITPFKFTNKGSEIVYAD